METIGEMIAAYCERSGSTRQAIANDVGVTPNQLRRKLRGNAPIYLDEAGTLSKILGVSIEDVYMASPRRRRPSKLAN